MKFLFLAAGILAALVVPAPSPAAPTKPIIAVAPCIAYGGKEISVVCGTALLRAAETFPNVVAESVPLHTAVHLTLRHFLYSNCDSVTSDMSVTKTTDQKTTLIALTFGTQAMCVVVDGGTALLIRGRAN